MTDRVLYEETLKKLKASGKVTGIREWEDVYPTMKGEKRVAAMRVEGLNKEVQLILMDKQAYPGNRVEYTYRTFSDRVGQITYRLNDKGERIFEVPDQCRHIAVEGLRKHGDIISHERQSKYEPRLKYCGNWDYMF